MIRSKIYLVLTFIFLTFFFSRLHAQTIEKKGIIYNSSFAGGFQLYNKGWSANIEFAKIKNFHKRTFYQIEFAQLKNEKEVRQTIDLGFSIVGINAPKPFVYGKENNFYTLNFSSGQQRMIGQRANKTGVEVSIKYLGGFSLGILKPYYLQLLVPIDNDTYYLDEQKYSEENKNLFLDWYSIYGAAGFKKGLNEPKFIPGIHLKAGLIFDWAIFDEFIKALEVGGSLDLYPKKVPILIYDNNKPYFANFYIGVLFGKKKS